MKHITLVRHGQASFWRRITTSVCERRGASQIAGKVLVAAGHDFHNAYAGPRLRQQETARIVAEVFRNAGHSFRRSR